MSSSMRNFMEAYAAVHNTEAKEELFSSRDCISEMNLSQLTDTDLVDVVEGVLEQMFQEGFSVNEAHEVFSDMFVESNIAGRQNKIDRLCEALNVTFGVIASKASDVALEEFAKYRYNKNLKESWSDRFNQEKRVQRHHGALVAQESLNVKTLLLHMVSEHYKGKHGQSEKEYQDDRSQGGKIVSGDSKGSGAKYAQGSRVNDGGAGPTKPGAKPTAPGKIDKGQRAEMEYRKANLKKKKKGEDVKEERLDEFALPSNYASTERAASKRSAQARIRAAQSRNDAGYDRDTGSTRTNVTQSPVSGTVNKVFARKGGVDGYMSPGDSSSWKPTASPKTTTPIERQAAQRHDQLAAAKADLKKATTPPPAVKPAVKPGGAGGAGGAGGGGGGGGGGRGGSSSSSTSLPKPKPTPAAQTGNKTADMQSWAKANPKLAARVKPGQSGYSAIKAKPVSTSTPSSSTSSSTSTPSSAVSSAASGIKSPRLASALSSVGKYKPKTQMNSYEPEGEMVSEMPEMKHVRTTASGQKRYSTKDDGRHEQGVGPDGKPGGRYTAKTVGPGGAAVYNAVRGLKKRVFGDDYQPEGETYSEGERAGLGGNRGLAAGGENTRARGDETSAIQRKQDAQRNQQNRAGARGPEFTHGGPKAPSNSKTVGSSTPRGPEFTRPKNVLRKEDVTFSETELKAFEEIVNSWED